MKEKLSNPKSKTQIRIDGAYTDGYNRGLEQGKIRGALDERKMIEEEQAYRKIEAIIKLVNAVGQTTSAAASTLHEDGVVARLLRQ